MWSAELASVCRRHPDLVAIYQAPDGGLALLLRQTLVPLHEERGRWFNETRRAARAAVASLRAAGVTEDVSVLQWRSLADVAAVLTGWLCCYLGDPERCAQLSDIVGARLADSEPAASAPHGASGDGRLRAAARAISPTLLQWYRDMAPCWLAVEPQLRRRLILRTHQWIVERVLLPMARGEPPATADLVPTGRLVWRLVRVVPPDELDVWKVWIRLTLTDLQRALAWPASRRTEAWARWLFAIPYSIPVAGRRARDVLPRSAGRHGGVA
jgi:hypothetical protein